MADDSQTNPEAASVANAPSRKPSPKPSKVLPTNRIGVPKQFELLRAFGALYTANNRPVRQQEVAEMVSLHTDTSRLANPFFLDTSLLQRTEAGLIPNADVLAFHRASQWNPEGAEQKLQPTLREAWFGKALLTRLSFAGALEDSAVVTLLAEQATASPEHRPQLQVLLGFLEAVGLITRDGNVIRPTRPAEGSVPPPVADQPRREHEAHPIAADAPPSTAKALVASTAMRTVTLPRCGGTLTLMGDFNPFELEDDERTLVYEIIDKMSAFQKGAESAKRKE